MVTYHYWLKELLKLPVKLATGIDIEELNGADSNGVKFDRKMLYKLSDLEEPGDYAIYDIKKFKKKSWDYLGLFLNRNTLVLGVELGGDLRQILTEMAVPFVNFWFHPFKLMDDIFFLVNTNNEILYKKILKYQLPDSFIRFQAIYWKERISRFPPPSPFHPPLHIPKIHVCLLDKLCKTEVFLMGKDFLTYWILKKESRNFHNNMKQYIMFLIHVFNIINISKNILNVQRIFIRYPMCLRIIC